MAAAAGRSLMLLLSSRGGGGGGAGGCGALTAGCFPGLGVSCHRQQQHHRTGVEEEVTMWKAQRVGELREGRKQLRSFTTIPTVIGKISFLPHSPCTMPVTS
ncbi:MCU isoform 7 [Pongo abelii]|uniref:MCU isoform 7 n=1 Tax=Pongo abelii TaxID=9601 RepID=A0A2J8U5U3_PONAB|nr:MCU isoform 7 [Pongo abelii]